MPRPVVVGGRKGFCSRAIPGPGPSQNPALCGSPPAKCSSASASYWCGGGTPLGALVLVRTTCRLPQLRCRVVPPSKAVCPAGPVTPLLLSPLLGKPPFGRLGLYPGRCSSSLCKLSLRATCRSFRAPGRQPFRLLAQTLSVCAVANPPKTAPVSSASALWRCTFVRGGVPVRDGRRAPLRCPCALTLSGPMGPGPGGRLPSHMLAVFAGVWEPKVSQPLRRQSPSAPSRSQTASGASAPLASLVPRPWSLADSQPPPHNPSPTGPAAVRLPATKAYYGTHARTAVRMRAEYHARRPIPWVNIYTLLQRRTAPLLSFMEVWSSV